MSVIKAAMAVTVPADFDDVDFFHARPLYQDPYPYYEYVRSHGPVWREPRRGIVMITGYEEAVAVYQDHARFSSCNTVAGPVTPFPLLVIADLLGVPEADHETFREQLQGEQRPTRNTRGGMVAHKPLEFLYDRFTTYIEDRRQEPRNDVMTQLAHATFPDGSLPPVDDVMRIASNLFAAGQETTARMMGTALRRLRQDAELQPRLP